MQQEVFKMGSEGFNWKAAKSPLLLKEAPMRRSSKPSKPALAPGFIFLGSSVCK